MSEQAASTIPAPRTSNRLFLLIIALVFFDTLLYGTIVPLIPVYTRLFSLTATDLGLMLAAYALGILLFSIPLGLLAEHIGYKKVFVFGGLFLTIGCSFFGMINAPWLLYLGRVVQGIAAAATWTAGLALIARLYPDQQGGKIGIVMAAVGMGTITGPPVGGVLYELFGHHWMFLLLGAFCGGILLFVAMLPFPVMEAKCQAEDKLTLKDIWANRRLVWFCLVFTITCCLFGLLEILLPNRMADQYGMSVVEIGLFFGGMGVIHAVSDMIWGKLSDKWGFAVFIFWGTLSCALFVPLLAITPSILLLFLAMVGIGCAAGAAITPGQPYMNQLVTEDPVLCKSGGSGFAYGLMNTCFSLGMILGPIIGGVLHDQIGFTPTIIGYGGCLALAAFIFQQRAVSKQPNQPKRV